MGTRLRLRVPGDYVLARDVCSYGYFLLFPHYWDPDRGEYSTRLMLDDGAALVRITQDGAEYVRQRWTGAGRDLVVVADRRLSRPEQGTARARISRMLRLDEDEDHVGEFHRVDPRWKKSGRARLMRSPTLFEDIIKTVTSCNVTWPSTVTMNRRLCEVVGVGGAFPTPGRLARTRTTTLRARCRVGYRDRRIIELARLFSPRGKRPPELEPGWFEDPRNDDETVCKRLLGLPGIGPYAAGNIMQLLGRYGWLALDSESVRHAKSVLGYTGTEAQVFKRLRAHYEPFGEHKFRSYWFELWTYYEAKAGPSWTWQRDTTGKMFTASQL